MQNDDLPAPPPLPPPSSDGPRTRRAWPWVLLGAVVVSLLAVAFGLPLSSYIVSLPGPVKNVEDRVTIKGSKTYPSHGSLSLTTVSFRSDPTPALLLLAALDPNQTILSTHDLIQSGNYHQLLKQEQLQMQQSKRNAIETALDALGYKKATGDGARVVYVQGGSPASGYLNVGDVVHSINGHRITTACDVSHALAVHPAGAKARFKVDHKGKAENLGFHTVDNPDLPGKQAFAGIGITTDHYHYNPGVDVHIDTSNIGGPSAGTMMALTIYDRLTPGDLTGGKAIAGTGTIDPCEGDVGPIGGVQEKVVAASRQGVATFLAPAQDAPAARRADHGDMKIVTIHTFSQALHYLKSHS